MREAKRSPLKDKPLRNPGQSLDEQRHDLALDKIATPLLMVVFLVCLAGLEWWRYYFPQEPSPFLYTFVALLAVGYAAFQIRKVRPKLRALRLGRDGEKTVGQLLEHLREAGYEVFHDVIGPGFNVDHVVIGPAGLFTIETKTISKRPGPDAKVVFDGESILVDGFDPDRDPVVQARAQTGWLRDLLAASTGRKFSVRPVILYPGWFVEQGKGTTRDIWVLEPKALPSYLAHEPAALSAEDVKLVSFHLSRFIRSGK
ncbi:MAG: nuclease-related domain-containing protein [Burkholderiales bacterium]